MTQNDGHTVTGPSARDTNTRDTISIHVSITYAHDYVEATFVDDRKAAEWASETLIELIQRHGIARWDLATVVFTRR